MSFLDKITDAAATIGDRAGDAIEFATKKEFIETKETRLTNCKER